MISAATLVLAARAVFLLWRGQTDRQLNDAYRQLLSDCCYVYSRDGWRMHGGVL